jgi:hypothetical protein
VNPFTLCGERSVARFARVLRKRSVLSALDIEFGFVDGLAARFFCVAVDTLDALSLPFTD